MTLTELPKPWEPLIEVAAKAAQEEGENCITGFETGLRPIPFELLDADDKKMFIDDAKLIILAFINAAIESGVAEHGNTGLGVPVLILNLGEQP